MNDSWWNRPIRIAALQYNGESAPMAVPALWREAGFNVEQLLHVFGDGYHAAFDESRHGEVLKKC